MNPWPAMGVASAAAAAGITAWGAVSPASQLYGPTLRHVGPGELALTFDDGPNPAITPALLALLERNSAQATFFVIGKFARECPGLVREIAARGHAIGNHTDTHRNLFFQSRAGIREELTRCQDAVAQATQTDPPVWMRPPYGFRNPLLDGQLRHAGLRAVVMWSLLCHDWKPQAPEKLIAALQFAARPRLSRGHIVLLHDGDHRRLHGDRTSMIAALAHWLPRWRAAGVEFVTMASREPQGAEAKTKSRGI